MSSGSPEQRGDLVRELRQFQDLSTTFLRAVAGRIGMTLTDMQVIVTLQTTGPATAGQLAEIAGLTTGAITGLLNRLEEAGIVQRERDPADGRRVIVRLRPDQESLRDLGPLLDTMSQAWQAMTATYSEEQVAFLREFLHHSNARFQQEIMQLRAAPTDGAERYAAPLGAITDGQLVVVGSARLAIRGGSEAAQLYTAHFDGPAPDVKTKAGTVTINYPRRLWGLGVRQRAAEIRLSPAIPWHIVIQSGAAEIVAELGGVDLAGLDIKGGTSVTRLDLPVPTAVVPLRISGGASEIRVRRPGGVAVRLHLKGWVSQVAFDDQTLNNMGNDVRLQSAGYNGTGPCYDIEIASSASMVTISTD